MRRLILFGILIFILVQHVWTGHSTEVPKFIVKCAKRFGPCADEYCNLFDGCLNCEPGFCDLTVRSQHKCIKKCPLGMHCYWENYVTKTKGTCEKLGTYDYAARRWIIDTPRRRKNYASRRRGRR